VEVFVGFWGDEPALVVRARVEVLVVVGAAAEEAVCVEVPARVAVAEDVEVRVEAEDVTAPRTEDWARNAARKLERKGRFGDIFEWCGAWSEGGGGSVCDRGRGFRGFNDSEGDSGILEDL
jgi:nicotinamidase-related amidase